VLAVWRLDRLGRSLKHLIELIGELEAERIGFQSVTEFLDTTTPGGKQVFHIFGALADFERNLIRERTYAGLAAARARGRRGGRRKKLGDKQRAVAVDLYRQKRHTIDEICNAVGISTGCVLRGLTSILIASPFPSPVSVPSPLNRSRRMVHRASHVRPVPF